MKRKIYPEIEVMTAYSFESDGSDDSDGDDSEDEDSGSEEDDANWLI